MPRPGGRDVPIGYVELGFHTNPDDAALLGQVWFRNRAAVGFARACESELRQRTDPLSGLDVIALLRAMFGDIPVIAGLATGAAPLGAGPVNATQVVEAITAVCGQLLGVPEVAAPSLDSVVIAIEGAAEVSTRELAVFILARALTPHAGYNLTDLDAGAPPSEAAAAANAVLRPLITALGGAIPITDVPTMAHLPRGDRPVTRAETAAALAAGLGIRPGDLATITRPVHGETVMQATAGPERPDAGVPLKVLKEAATKIGKLRPIDVYRLVAARLTDARGNTLPTPLAPGEEVYLAIETGGTAWRITAADVRFIVRRAGLSDVELGCAVRRDDMLMSGSWLLPTTTGTLEYSVSAAIRHPRDGALALHPLRFSVTVQARP
jgi:hypothetical protein